MTVFVLVMCLASQQPNLHVDIFVSVTTCTKTSLNLNAKILQ